MKTDIVLDWAKSWPELEGYLKLNGIVTEDGEKTISTVSNERIVQEYINGDAIREYTFALSYMVGWSSGFDEVNQEAMRLGESWLNWVIEQNKKKNFPALPNVEKVEPLQNIPTLAMVFEQDSLAKYQFQCKITYRD